MTKPVCCWVWSIIFIPFLLSLLSWNLVVHGQVERSSSSLNERVVTDLSTILSHLGLPVDFRYNETYSGKGEMSSVPGCPKSVDGYPWVYYGNPPRCHLAGHQGPCSFGRVLFVEKGSPFGLCSCECFQHKAIGEPLDLSPDKRYTFCPVTEQVHDNEKKICYDLQNQGPCEYGQWLVRDRQGTSLVCVPACPFGLFYDYKQGRCINLRLLGSEFGGSMILPDCPQKHLMYYSSVLRKCVLKRPNDILFLG